jgi:hypothetical protein
MPGSRRAWRLAIHLTIPRLSVYRIAYLSRKKGLILGRPFHCFSSAYHWKGNPAIRDILSVLLSVLTGIRRSRNPGQSFPVNSRSIWEFPSPKSDPRIPGHRMPFSMPFNRDSSVPKLRDLAVH